jgi:hypothetical protein
MVAADIYQANQWHDFFITAGSAAAVLTGLVFVAISLNVNVVTQDATHRYRAIGTLTGFTAVFLICSLGLMGGQDYRAVAVEWLLVSAGAGTVYVGGLVQAFRLGKSPVGLYSPRLMFGTALHIAEASGAALLLSGKRAGLYVAAVAMVVLLAYMISGAWLLIVGISELEPQRQAEL